MNAKITTIAYGGAFLVLGLLALKLVKDGAQLGQGAAKVAGEVLDAINPTNPDNVFASGVNKVVKTVTGDESATLGSKLFDIFNPSATATAEGITRPTVIGKPAPGAGLPDFASDDWMPAPTPHFDWRQGLADVWMQESTAIAQASRIVNGSGGAAFGLYPRP